jgi:uncharacterized protein DUF5650/dockerin type I repeat protein
MERRTSKSFRRRLTFEALEQRRVFAAAFAEFVDPHPTPGDLFGSAVVPLSTGNVVVTAPYDTAGGDKAGAVYLFNGRTGALISTLTGSHANDYVGSAGVTALTNGNFVVRSPAWDGYDGAVTWGNGISGVSGDVSGNNSLIGTAGRRDQVGNTGLTALANGNYVVSSGFWYYTSGAATWGDGTKGATGEVSTANSLCGNSSNCYVGVNGVTALTNGNYVVLSSQWTLNGGINNVGAVTWGDGTKGITGYVASYNSLTGSQANDRVGGGGITALPNGNYVVGSPNWADGTTASVGAVTWGDGAQGISGTIDSTNSLIGSTANDQIGGYTGVTVLTNGNYVVRSPNWYSGTDANVGAVTWGDGTTGVSGTVSSKNSLIGSMDSDQIGSGGITALSNGSYVVDSPLWSGNEFHTPLSSGSLLHAGAVTWCDGTSGRFGVVGVVNSLVGTTANDQVGSGGVTALTTGNYVVNSPLWNLNLGIDFMLPDAGAVTWGSGTSGVTGAVLGSRSLIGFGNDQVGSGGVTALTNGNYVVSSPFWNGDFGAGESSAAAGLAFHFGAVTLCDGASGTGASVTSDNSLNGGNANDQVGSGGVTALANGNYVVSSPSWSGSTGAVTWGNGMTGVSGRATSGNSLVGGAANDQVGSGGIKALTNGNYVVLSKSWSNNGVQNAGAATFASGATGVTGKVSPANSLVGSAAGDRVGSDGVRVLSNGAYIVISTNWNSSAGAVTFGDGTSGIHGVVSAANSLAGAIASSGLASTVPLDNVNKTFFGQFTSEGRVRVGSQLNGVAAPWQNVLKPTDVTNDGTTAPNDATDIILYLNGYGAVSVPANAQTSKPFGLLDVNGDGVIAPNDLVDVIIYLNAYGAGEGESASSTAGAQPVVADLDSGLPSNTEDLFALLASDTALSGQPRRRAGG